MLEIWTSWGKNGRYALCDAFYTCFQTSWSLLQKTNKKCLGKTVMKMWSQMLTKNGLKQ